MRKSTVFISAVLTTFSLAMLYSVVSAYRGNKNLTAVTAQATATLMPDPTDTPAPTEFAITPEDAAHLAAQVVGNSNLLSAESSNINGVDAYKITFTNNDVVYVSPDGQILSVQVAPVVLNVPPPAKPQNKNKGGGGNVNSGSSESNASGGEHEERDD